MKKVQRGQQQLSAREYNKLVTSASAHGKISVQPPLELVTAGGVPMLRLIPGAIWAEISSSMGAAYGWEEVQPDGSGNWAIVVGGKTGTPLLNPAYEVNGNTINITTVVRLRPGLNDEWLFEVSSGGGSDESFLVILMSKCYDDGSGTSACMEGTCESGPRFIQYGWIKVIEDTDTTCALTYNEQLLCGGPGCQPAYHIQNLDLPIFRYATSGDCCNTADTRTNLISPHSIVRIRKGAGDFYLVEQPFWTDLFRRTGESDSDGEICFQRYFDQNDNTWKDGEEVRLIVEE